MSDRIKETLRPAWVEIDLDNLGYNVESVKRRVGNRELIGVVKADGYGCGAVRVCEKLSKMGVSWFATMNSLQHFLKRAKGRGKSQRDHSV